MYIPYVQYCIPYSERNTYLLLGTFSTLYFLFSSSHFYDRFMMETWFFLFLFSFLKNTQSSRHALQNDTYMEDLFCRADYL